MAQNALTMIAMNANGQHQPHLLDVAERKKEAITKLINNEKPDLILFQEFTLGKDFWDKDDFEDYEYIHCSKHTSLLYNKKELSCATSFYFTAKCKGMIKYCPDISIPFVDLINSVSHWITESPNKTEKRLCMSIMTGNSKRLPEFVCISWHSPYNELGEQGRTSLLEGLLQILDNWFIKHSIPVFLGGDFNISYTLARPLISSQQEIVNSMEKKMFFVVSKSSIIEKNVEKIDKNQFIDDLNELEIFDHHPVRLKVEFDLSEDFQRLAVSRFIRMFD